MRQTWLIVILMITSTLLSGCNQEQTIETDLASADQVVMYENEKYGITIYENSDWQFVSEKQSENINIKLSHFDQLHAIITTASSEKSFAMIKQELIAGAGDVDVITEDDNTMSYQSKLQDAIRTDIYFKPNHGKKHVLVIFMSPVSVHEKVTPYIGQLLNNLKLTDE